jgi:hypothetical protein
MTECGSIPQRAGRSAMRRAAISAGSFVLAFGLLSAGPAGATCGEECDGEYASAIDDCKSQYGDDPADADELATCIQEARDSYRSCLDNCAADASPVQPQQKRRAAILARLQTFLAARGLRRVQPYPLDQPASPGGSASITVPKHPILGPDAGWASRLPDAPASTRLPFRR